MLSAGSTASAGADLPGRLEVGQGTRRAGVVRHHGLLIARRLGDPYRAGDRRFQHLVGEVGAHLVGHAGRQPGPGVVHGEQDGGHLQAGVEVRAHHLHRAQQLAHPLQRVVLALDRDQDLLPGHQRVDGEQAERGRAVDEHVVQPFARGLLIGQVGGQRPPQPGLPGHQRDQVDLRAGQVDGGGQHGQTGQIRTLPHQLVHRPLVDERLVDARCALFVLDAQRGGGVALGVEVDEQHLLAPLGEAGGHVHRGRGLAHAALLVRDHEHPGTRRRLAAARSPGRRARAVPPARSPPPTGCPGPRRGRRPPRRRRARPPSASPAAAVFPVKHARARDGSACAPDASRARRARGAPGAPGARASPAVPGRALAPPAAPASPTRCVPPLDRCRLVQVPHERRRPRRSLRPGRSGPALCSLAVTSTTRVGGSRMPSPYVVSRTAVPPVADSASWAAASSSAAACPLNASSRPPGRSSGSVQPSSRSNGATARAVTTSTAQIGDVLGPAALHPDVRQVQSRRGVGEEVRAGLRAVPAARSPDRGAAPPTPARAGRRRTRRPPRSPRTGRRAPRPRSSAGGGPTAGAPPAARSVRG